MKKIPNYNGISGIAGFPILSATLSANFTNVLRAGFPLISIGKKL
jgi:hypothetical protein